MKRPDVDSLIDSLQGNAKDLLSYFERRTSQRHDAADLLAETMLVAWRRRDSLPNDHHGRRLWLFTTAGFVLANHRRSTRRSTALASKLRALIVEENVPSAGQGVDVRDAVQRLPPKQRELVMLVHWDGFTLAEAASVLGLSPSTARGRYSDARSKLKDTLSAHARSM